MPEESLVFRREGFSPSLSLLMPTFAFEITPAYLTVHIRRNFNALLPRTLMCIRSFGVILDARLL